FPTAAGHIGEADFMTTPATEAVALAVMVAALLAAAVSDVQRYLIPNRYPIAIVLAYLVYAIGQPLEQGLLGLATGAAAFGFCAGLFVVGVFGGGDAKLLAATMVWAGPALAASLLVYTVLAGGALALAWLTPLRRLMPAAPQARASVDPAGLRSRFHQPTPY